MLRSFFVLTNKWVILLTEQKKKDNTYYVLQPVCTYLKVKYCCQDVSTGKRMYCIEVYDGENYKDIILDSDVLTIIGVRKLLDYGCVFPDYNSNYVLRYLVNSAVSAEIKLVHSGLGWKFSDDQVSFLSGKSINTNGVASSYVGPFNIEPKGSYEAWRQMYREEVQGNTALEFCTILGAASPVLAYLNHYMDLGCIVFNLSNSSSKGKTTSAMLAVSLFGDPAFQKGFITTLNSTTNAIIGFISQANSHTVVLDEAATAEKKEFRRILYQICSGRDKMRLNTDGSMKDTHNFNSIVITTAEFSIIDETAAPNGIRARVFEIDSELTNSSENSNRIKQCVYQNYGHAGQIFIEFIVKNKINTILDDYSRAEQDLISAHKEFDYTEGELTSRIISKLAVILLTCDYINESLDLKINRTEIISFLLQLEQKITNEADIGSKAIDCILQYISRNKGRFIIDHNEEFLNKIEGKLEGTSKYTEVTILRDTVKSILESEGFENPKLVYQAWDSKKMLIHEKDRLIKRVRLSKDIPAQPCFIIKISKI